MSSLSATSGTAEESKTFCGEPWPIPACSSSPLKDLLLAGAMSSQTGINIPPLWGNKYLTSLRKIYTQLKTIFKSFVKSEDSLVNSGIGINMTGHSFLLVIYYTYYNKHIPAPLLGCSSIPVQKQKGNCPALKLTKLLDSVLNKPQLWNFLHPPDPQNMLLSCNSDKAGRTKFNKISWSKFWERKHYFRSQCQNSVCLK